VVAQFRQAMIGAGLAQTPMLANEIGWYTIGSGVPQWAASEQDRAGMIAGVANRLWRTDCGVSGLAPYSWVTLEQNPADSEQWYGLADARTGAPHSSGVAYGDQIRVALGRAAQAPPRTLVNACSSGTCTKTTRARKAARRSRARRARARKAAAKCGPHKRRSARSKRR
jgi:hypothetical protein